MMSLTTTDIEFVENDDVEKENWRQYRAEFNSGIVVWIYCSENIRPINLEIELIEIGGIDDD